MKGILTAKALNIEQLKRMTHDKNIVGGTEDYAAGRVSIGRVEPQWAQAVVLDAKTNKPYTVGVRSNADGVSLTCTCRDAYLWVPCRHRYAAALALRDYLEEHPPKIWKTVLDQAAQTAPRRTTTNNGLILFSLIERNNNSWAVLPYTLNTRHFDDIDLSDRKAVGDAIVRRGMSSDAKALRSRVSRSAYPLATEDDITAANLALGNPYAAYGYASSRESSAYYEAVLPYLSRCLAFIGEEGDPLQAELNVKSEQGTVEAELVQTRKGLQMQARIAVGEETIAIKPRDLTALSRDPLWLLVDTTLVRVAPLDGVATALLDNPNLLIPPEDTEEFYERYLLPISERIPVRGSMLEWEDVEATPEARLYLSEQEGALQAELRFGYGPYEVPNEKNAPAQTVRRVPGATRFARIKRDVVQESEAAGQLGANYGFKKGPEPHIFPLRANVNPIDFLLHQVPKLVAKGFTVFGEEALVGAKVNRNKPTISFNVSSGIDWFDVEANVNFGELAVSLKDIRQAVKKRERYVKLADGSIGALPEEWIEKYRHMLVLGNDAGKDTLRFNNSQLTLIDQLLGEADRAQTDEAFRQRREKLRNFENIASQPLPEGFKGELRPYQKFGYDWLHFLQEYNFGGCLADDMGVGKCVLPDTQLFVNGELHTAESLWSNFSKETWFDGEGDWSKPTQELKVNALDQTTNRVVEAPITRLYRQEINERVRRVTLEDGSAITTTLRHKLLTSTGWSNQLAVGNYVCLPGQLNWQGQTADPQLVELLAWQIAEGYEQNERATVSITQIDTTRLERLRTLLLQLADRYNFVVNRPTVRFQEGKVPALFCTSIGYRAFLASCGYTWGLCSRDKRIPSFVMQADNATVALFLRHLFEAEACALAKNRVVEISSASQTMMHQVATLLRRFGIWMRIATKRKCATNGSRTMRTYYSGYISGNAARLFAKHIGFVGEHKQQALQELCSFPANTNTEGIPASHLVAYIVTTSHLPVRHFGMHNTVYINGTQQFSRESLTRVVHALDHVASGEAEQAYRALAPSKWTTQTLAAYAALDKAALAERRQQLHHLLEQEVFYCRVVSVEEFNYQGWVYDFEVEEHHNFVANGMLCHNTIQTLAFLESIYDRENDAPATLIVMPRSLLFNWQREAEKFTPNLDVYVHADQGRIADPKQFNEHDLVLTTYGTMLRDIELLRKYEFHHVILDESQAIKNPVAETSKAARLLHGKHRLALTGTPIENTTLELWSQFAFLNPGLLGSVDYFRQEFANPIERHQNGDTAQFLRKMVFPFILRRTKDQVATDLPPRTEEIMFCNMEPSQRKLYVKQRDYYRASLLGMIDDGGMDDARMKILEGLLRLRQICNHPKLVDDKFKGDSGKFERLLEMLDTLRAEGHRALIFSQFVQMLSIVRDALDAKKIPYAYLDGQTRDRQAQVDRFQNDGSLPFFLISLKAGGVGLNLTAADYVIHIDPWWNPAVEQQATDRTHRIGQDKPVFVYKFVARDSVEEKILKLQDQKRELVSQIISAEGGVFKSLTRDDVAVLFS